MDETPEMNRPAPSGLSRVTTAVIYGGVLAGAVFGAARERGWDGAIVGAMVMSLVGGFAGVILAAIIHLLARGVAALLALIRPKT